MKKLSIFCFIFLICSCSVSPEPFSIKERYQQAQLDVKRLFSIPDNVPNKLTFYEALARAVKYDLDYRIKRANTALQAGQLSVAEYAMFPALNVTGSLYTRNNDLASSGITTAGNITDVLNSTPRTLRSFRTAVSWNILDFGMGYVRARQQSERVLIAHEESRKQLQRLTQDILVAYWKAYSAQEMMKDTKRFQANLQEAKRLVQAALLDKTVPHENLLTYQAALYDGNKRFSQLQYEYDKSVLDLKHLINLPPDTPLKLAPPPRGPMRVQNLSKLDFAKLDAITLVTRPELRSQKYQERIAKFGVKATLIQAFPGFTLNAGWNFNSNKFLVNNEWVDRSVDLAWNLLNLASLPTAYKTAKVQVEYENLKSLALTLTALTETRYAFSHYQTLQQQYFIAHQQTENAQVLYKLTHDRNLASLASRQQVIIAKLRTITTKMDENLLLSELSQALGELYLSIGFDILPMDVDQITLRNAVVQIQEKMEAQTKSDLPIVIDRVYKTIFPPTKIYASKQTVYKHSDPYYINPLKSVRHHASAKLAWNLPKTNLYKNIIATKISTPKKNYTLQVFGSYHLSVVKNLHKQMHLSKYLVPQTFRTKHNGKNWYVLTLGNYSNVRVAKQSLTKLPPHLQNLRPWVRETKQLSFIG